jgi:ZIP family zinc transporter
LLTLVLAGTATALATGLGALPVFLLGDRAEALRPALWGLAAGVMAVASVAGLLLPALDEGSVGEVGAGLAAGILFLVVSRAIVDRSKLATGTARGVGVRASVLVFAVLLVHSLPEGFAIGTAYASDTEGLAVFVILAIAIQNIPEGTSVAIPLEATGASASRQFWAAVATSAPQPVGAVVAYLLVEEIEALLPFSFAFAAGAMLALVVVELLPDAVSGGRWATAGAGFLLGALAMLAASAALGV